MSELAKDIARHLRFGGFRLELDGFRLFDERPISGPVEVPLTPKAFDVLSLLARNPDRIISVDEFMSAVWPRIHVQPEVLKGHIMQVRMALADRNPPYSFVETVRGRGYRFIGSPGSNSPAAIRAPRERPAEIMVGRDGALAELHGAFHSISSGTQIVFLTGEPGIGKTTLANCFAGAVSGRANVAQGRCLSGGSENDAYYPILELLSDLVRSFPEERIAEILAGLAPTWRELPGIGPSVGPAGTVNSVVTPTHRMIAELIAALAEISKTTPLMLLIEDLHWADRSTLDLLRAIATRSLRSKILIVLTGRIPIGAIERNDFPAFVGEMKLYGLAKEVRLGSLNQGEVLQYITEKSRAAPPVELAELLHKRSDGNPLFLIALLDHLVQCQMLEIGFEQWNLKAALSEIASKVPPNLAETIGAEIDRLGAEARSVLDAASISVGPFSPHIHCVATKSDELLFEQLCEELCRTSRLVERAQVYQTPDGAASQSYVFRHALFQEIVLDRQGLHKRRRSHLSVARRLMEVHAKDLSAVAPTLARHFAEAGEWTEAVKFLRTASRTALQRFARSEATALLEEAVVLAASISDGHKTQTEIVLLDELARIYTGRYDLRAVDVYEQVASKAVELGRDDLLCLSLVGKSFALSWHDLGKGVAALDEAIAMSSHIEQPALRAWIRVSAHSWRSWIMGANQPDFDAATAALETLRNLGDARTVSAAEMYYSLLLFQKSRYREAARVVSGGVDALMANPGEDHANLSLALWFVRLGVPWGMIFAGEFHASIEGFEAAAAAFEGDSDFYGAVTIRLYQSFCLTMYDKTEEALGQLEAALRLAKRHEISLYPSERRVAAFVRGMSYISCGRIIEAQEIFAEALRDIEDKRVVVDWYWEIAVVYGATLAALAAGNVSEATQKALDLQLLCETCGEVTWNALSAECTARVAYLRGDKAAGLRGLEEGRDALSTVDAPYAIWRLDLATRSLAATKGDKREERLSR